MIARLLTVVLLFILSLASPTTVSNSGRHAYTAITKEEEGKALLSYIKSQCSANRVPVKLVHNVIRMESKWRNADSGEVVGGALLQSSEDAYGLMQVQLSTAMEMVETDTITAQQLMDDNYLNVKAGVRYLAWLRDYYDGNWYFAVAAYNRGIRNVNRDLTNGNNPMNNYAYNASNGVFFGKKTTLKMEAEVAKLRDKANFQEEVIAEVNPVVAQLVIVCDTVLAAK